MNETKRAWQDVVGILEQAGWAAGEGESPAAVGHMQQSRWDGKGQVYFWLIGGACLVIVACLIGAAFLPTSPQGAVLTRDDVRREAQELLAQADFATKMDLRRAQAAVTEKEAQLRNEAIQKVRGDILAEAQRQIQESKQDVLDKTDKNSTKIATMAVSEGVAKTLASVKEQLNAQAALLDKSVNEAVGKKVDEVVKAQLDDRDKRLETLIANETKQRDKQVADIRKLISKPNDGPGPEKRPDDIKGWPIYAQLSSMMTQLPKDDSQLIVQMENNDALSGLTHDPKAKSGDITIKEDGVYFVVAAVQVGKTSGETEDFVDVWIKQNGKDVDNSGCRQAIPDPKFTTVLVSQGVAECKAGDVLNVAISASSPGKGLGIFAFSPKGQATIPSIILSIYKIK